MCPSGRQTPQSLDRFTHKIWGAILYARTTFGAMSFEHTLMQDSSSRTLTPCESKCTPTGDTSLSVLLTNPRRRSEPNKKLSWPTTVRARFQRRCSVTEQTLREAAKFINETCSEEDIMICASVSDTAVPANPCQCQGDDDLSQNLSGVEIQPDCASKARQGGAPRAFPKHINDSTYSSLECLNFSATPISNTSTTKHALYRHHNDKGCQQKEKRQKVV